MASKPANRRALRGTGLYWSVLVTFLLAVAILIGIIQNLQTVELKYLGWDLRTPLVVVLLVTVLAAVLLAALVGVSWRHRRRRQLADRDELRELRHRTDESVATTSEPSLGAEPPPPSTEPPAAHEPSPR